MSLLDGRVAIVSGAGRGVGRAYVMMLAKHGAKVLVNDVGSTAAGTGTGESPAKEVVGAIRAAGGEAAVNTSDVSDWAAASLDPTDIGARIEEIVRFTRANAGVDRNIWHRP